MNKTDILKTKGVENIGFLHESNFAKIYSVVIEKQREKC